MTVKGVYRVNTLSLSREGRREPGMVRSARAGSSSLSLRNLTRLCDKHPRVVSKRCQGLTLIEVLIALAIIAIAMTAVIKSTSQNIRGTNYLQSKSIATWVAQERLNEVRVGVLKFSDELNGKLESLGQTWYWHLKQSETPNKRMKKITINVSNHEIESSEDSSIVTLEAYVYADQVE